MSDYRRFISYIYEYRQGTKAESRGFVRVEARSGACTLEIHMKLPALTAGIPITAYGFIRKDTSLEGLLLHRSPTGNGFFDARFVTETSRMGQSSYSLGDLSGLLLLSDSGQCYGTSWDDAPIQPELFSRPESPKAALGKAPSPNLDRESPSQQAPEATAAAASETAGPREAKKPLTQQPFVPAPEEEPLSQQLFVPAPEEEPLSQQPFIPAPEEEPLSQRPFVPAPEEESSPKVCSAAQAEPPLPVSRSCCPDPRWFQIQQRYPSIRPFSDDAICECVRLKLQDLPALRREGWLIGSNRFLLHGCYGHSHLLMGRLCGKGGCCYILGVPGFYSRQEQFMANSFGFPCFHPAADQKFPDRTFGYWYRPVS